MDLPTYALYNVEPAAIVTKVRSVFPAPASPDRVLTVATRPDVPQVSRVLIPPDRVALAAVVQESPAKCVAIAPKVTNVPTVNVWPVRSLCTAATKRDAPADLSARIRAVATDSARSGYFFPPLFRVYFTVQILSLLHRHSD